MVQASAVEHIRSPIPSRGCMEGEGGTIVNQFDDASLASTIRFEPRRHRVSRRSAYVDAAFSRAEIEEAPEAQEVAERLLCTGGRPWGRTARHRRSVQSSFCQTHTLLVNPKEVPQRIPCSSRGLANRGIHKLERQITERAPERGLDRPQRNPAAAK